MHRPESPPALNRPDEDHQPTQPRKAVPLLTVSEKPGYPTVADLPTLSDFTFAGRLIRLDFTWTFPNDASFQSGRQGAGTPSCLRPLTV